MNNEVMDLKNEIELLNERISILEKRDSRRRSLSYLKIIIKILIIGAIIFGIWRGYEYVVNEIPHMMEEKINDFNPFKKK